MVQLPKTVETVTVGEHSNLGWFLRLAGGILSGLSAEARGGLGRDADIRGGLADRCRPCGAVAVIKLLTSGAACLGIVVGEDQALPKPAYRLGARHDAPVIGPT